MSKTYLNILKENTKEAKKQWGEFAKECNDIEDFKKRFHLRPKRNGVTIVSTLKEKPMRGITCPKTKVKDALKKLDSLKKGADLRNELGKIGFKDKKRSKKKAVEEDYQVKMISGMSENASLKEKLKVDKLIFIASEFIYHEKNDKSKRERVDIIGYDGKNRLFFYELKEPDSKENACEQVKRYVDIYSVEKRKEVLEILKEYPINSVIPDNIVVEGYGVYGYGEEIVSFHEASIDRIGCISLRQTKTLPHGRFILTDKKV